MAEKELSIQRVNSYNDPRFSPRVLRQHGAFLVNDVPCEVEITGADTAVVRGVQERDAIQLIEEFRFYAEHISRFYDDRENLLAEYPPVRLFSIRLSEIQPSQFFVDDEKLSAVKTFLSAPEDIIIPVIRREERYVSLDGHTRLAAAIDAGFDTVFAFLSDSGDAILGFVEEAKRRGILSPYDMRRVPHEEYEVVWNQFCEEFFEEKQKENQEP